MENTGRFVISKREWDFDQKGVSLSVLVLHCRRGAHLMSWTSSSLLRHISSCICFNLLLKEAGGIFILTPTCPDNYIMHKYFTWLLQLRPLTLCRSMEEVLRAINKWKWYFTRVFLNFTFLLVLHLTSCWAPLKQETATLLSSRQKIAKIGISAVFRPTLAPRDKMMPPDSFQWDLRSSYVLLKHNIKHAVSQSGR